MEDLTVEQWSYIIGFLQGDGTLSGSPDGKGKMSVELSERDRDILDLLEQVLPFEVHRGERTRDTNFKADARSVVLYVCDMDSRKLLCERGLPYGQKSDVIAPPPGEYSRVDYIRGLVDADGSVGFTTKGLPFLSLTLSSDAVRDEFVSFISDITGLEKKSSRNARDGVYNIAVFKEDAQAVAATLYTEGCLSLARKHDAAREIQQWSRPAEMRKQYRAKRWTAEDDEVVLNHSTSEAAELLGRTVKSVNVRRWRLNGGEKCTN